MAEAAVLPFLASGAGMTGAAGVGSGIGAGLGGAALGAGEAGALAPTALQMAAAAPATGAMGATGGILPAVAATPQPSMWSQLADATQAGAYAKQIVSPKQQQQQPQAQAPQPAPQVHAAAPQYQPTALRLMDLYRMQHG